MTVFSTNLSFISRSRVPGSKGVSWMLHGVSQRFKEISQCFRSVLRVLTGYQGCTAYQGCTVFRNVLWDDPAELQECSRGFQEAAQCRGFKKVSVALQECSKGFQMCSMGLKEFQGIQRAPWCSMEFHGTPWCLKIFRGSQRQPKVFQRFSGAGMSWYGIVPLEFYWYVFFLSGM